jgi:cation transport regulator ChaB
MLTVRRSSSKVFPKLRFINMVRNRDEETEFSCSDPVFNKIWETGRETLQQCVNNIFMDSPCGRRSQSLPEAFVESQAAFYAFGECALSAKALKEFALAQTENGNIPEFSSNGVYSHVPDYALLWPMWLDAHFQNSGDADFRDEMLEHLDLLLDFFGTLAKEDGGILVDLDRRYRMRAVIDRAPIDRRGMSTALNALYCRALLSAANLYESANMREEAESCRKTASSVAKAVRNLASDPNRRLFADCCLDGRRSESHSLQTNILALLSGVAPLDSYEHIMNAFFGPEAPHLSKSSSPLFKYFILETMFAFGHADEALQFVKRYWGAMLNAGEGLWWSHFDPEGGRETIDPETLQCYGGAVSPNIFLIRELAGIRPAVPGFSRIYFNPR